MRPTRPLAFAVLALFAAFASALRAQHADIGEQVANMTFPEFASGDGRQKLSEFAGQTVIVATFADVFGGLPTTDEVCSPPHVRRHGTQ